MEILDKQQVLNKLKEDDFKFAWINTFSNLYLKEFEKYDDLENDLDNLIEAKFFNEGIELSIMTNQEGNFSVVRFESKGKEYVEEVQRITKHKSVFKGFKNELVIRNYIDYDKAD